MNEMKQSRSMVLVRRAVDRMHAAPKLEPEDRQLVKDMMFAIRDMQDAKDLYPDVLVRVREVAHRHGYAIGVHGSQTRDLDLIAAPWRNDPSDAHKLAKDIKEYLCATENPKFPNPDIKPCGRIAYSFYLNETQYIDLSIMPTNEPVTSLHMLRDALDIEEEQKRQAVETLATIRKDWSASLAAVEQIISGLRAKLDAKD